MTTANATMGFDELLAIGEVEGLLEKTKEVCEIKLRGKKFAGMEHQDVVQEVMIKVFNSIETYDSSKAKASTYFDRIIGNMIKDCYKKAMSGKNLMVVNSGEISDGFNEEEQVDESYIVGEVDVEFENKEFLIDITENLGLNEKEKEIFELRSGGYEFVEIADILGVSKARISQIWKGIKNKYDAM